MSESLLGTGVLKRVDSAVWRQIDGQVAIISIDLNRVRVLNEVASFVWERCDGRTLDGLVDEVTAEFSVERSQAEADLRAFISDLSERGLLKVASEGNAR